MGAFAVVKVCVLAKGCMASWRCSSFSSGHWSTAYSDGLLLLLSHQRVWNGTVLLASQFLWVLWAIQFHSLIGIFDTSKFCILRSYMYLRSVHVGIGCVPDFLRSSLEKVTKSRLSLAVIRDVIELQ